VERIERVLLPDVTSPHLNHVRDVLPCSIRVAVDVLIRKANDIDAVSSKHGCAIPILTWYVTNSVEFNRQAKRIAVKVEDVRSDRVLTPELPSDELAATKPTPDLRLGSRPILAQVTGAAERSGTLLVHGKTLRQLDQF
jgi:hypothetical protein